MLYIDKVQKTAEEVAELFGLPIAKIIKAPEFEINPARIQNRKFGQSEEISSPAGTRFPSAIFVKIPNANLTLGKTIELRYAEYMQPEMKGEKLIDVYYPYKVMFTGDSMLVDNMDIDLAIFFYLHPLNEYSPLRNQIKEKFHYSFNDKELKGRAAVAAGKILTQALQKALEYSGAQLKVLAKGLGVSGVESMEDENIQAELIQLAQKDPTGFLNKTNSNKTIIKGMIISGIDNGLFAEDNNNGRHRWIWGGGDKKGVEILEIFSNGQTPASETLIEYIFANINTYYPLLLTAHKTMNVEKTSSEFLDSQPLINLNDVFGGSTKDINLETVENIELKNTAANVVADAKKKVAASIPPVKQPAVPVKQQEAPIIEEPIENINAPVVEGEGGNLEFENGESIVNDGVKAQSEPIKELDVLKPKLDADITDDFDDEIPDFLKDKPKDQIDKKK